MKPYDLAMNEYPRLWPQAMHDLGLGRHFMETMPDAAYTPAFQNRPGSELGVQPRNPASYLPRLPFWSCSALARAAVRVLPFKLEWTVMDGTFGPSHTTRHSWLEHRLVSMPNGSMREGFILDIAPVGVVSGPILSNGSYTGQWERLYVPTPSMHPQSHLETYEAEAALVAETWNNR